MPQKPQYLKNAPHEVKKADRFYRSKYWQNRRAWYLRHHPACARCGQAATAVDHFDGNRENNSLDNYQSLCHRCHSRKTYQHDGAFGRIKNPEQKETDEMSGENNGVSITPSDTTTFNPPLRSIYCGCTGDIAAVMNGGQAVTFKAVPTGTRLEFFFQAVKATGTTATNLVGLY